MSVKDAVVFLTEQMCDRRDECSALRAALKKLLAAPGDHMTACDRTMGATHPCTCGANAIRALLSAVSGVKP
jgi:hypothetical protein